MRSDGRKPKQLRPLAITPSYIKTADGSVLIEVGDTRVICTAKLEERVPPFLRNSGKGWITAEYGMLPGSSQERIGRESARGRVGGRTHEIQRLIGRSLRAIADAMVRAAGSGRVEFVPWPPDRDAIDIGSYFGDSSKAKRMLGWEPSTDFAAGIERTMAFYRRRLSWYL